MQEWHGAGVMSSAKFGPGTRRNEEHRNVERAERERETVKSAGMQTLYKGPRPERAAVWKTQYKGPRHKTATASYDQKNNQRDLLEDCRTGVREAS
jgi:hypothetical protein